jgi:hypothetical protein
MRSGVGGNTGIWFGFLGDPKFGATPRTSLGGN